MKPVASFLCSVARQLQAQRKTLLADCLKVTILERLLCREVCGSTASVSVAGISVILVVPCQQP